MNKKSTSISNIHRLNSHHISKVLVELKANKLVECINPEVRKGILCRLTDKGEDLVKNLNKAISLRYSYLVFKISSFNLLNSLSGITGLPSSLTGLFTLAYLIPIFLFNI